MKKFIMFFIISVVAFLLFHTQKISSQEINYLGSLSCDFIKHGRFNENNILLTAELKDGYYSFNLYSVEKNELVQLNFEWNYKIEVKNDDDELISSIVFADLDGDNEEEIFVGTNKECLWGTGYIFKIDYKNKIVNLLWKKDMGSIEDVFKLTSSELMIITNYELNDVDMLVITIEDGFIKEVWKNQMEYENYLNNYSVINKNNFSVIYSKDENNGFWKQIKGTTHGKLVFQKTTFQEEVLLSYNPVSFIDINNDGLLESLNTKINLSEIFLIIKTINNNNIPIDMATINLDKSFIKIVGYDIGECNSSKVVLSDGTAISWEENKPILKIWSNVEGIKLKNGLFDFFKISGTDFKYIIVVQANKNFYDLFILR